MGRRGVSRRGIPGFRVSALAGPDEGPGSAVFPAAGETRHPAAGSDWASWRALLTHLLRVVNGTPVLSTLRTSLANGGFSYG